MDKLAKGIGRMCNEVIVKGEGSYVYSKSGRRLLDMSCGIGVANLGHCHPKIVEAIVSQAQKLNHAQLNLFYHDRMLELNEKLYNIMPFKQLDTFFYWNSGAEAVEAALKLARHYTKKQNIIVFEGSYHGRTFGTMSLTTSKTIYKQGYGPLLSSIETSPYPYCLHCTCRRAGSKYKEKCCLDPIRQLELLLKQRATSKDVAAILIEPVLGEGGYVVPPKEFLCRLRELCTREKILLIFDEVQSGFGRTGEMFASTHFETQPDILIMAKGIANGMPLSAITSRQEIMDVQPPGSMGGTYAGNAVSCAAAIATIDVFKEEKILEKSKKSSELFFKLLNAEFKKVVEQSGQYKVDIRGLGLMIGIEFYESSNDILFPYNKTNIANKISNYCLNNLDMIIMTASIFDTLRLIPPLNITEEEVKKVVQNLIFAFDECQK